MEAEEIQAQVDAGIDASTLPVGSRSSGATLRERWRRTMFFQKVDSIPNFEFGYWESTLPRWHEQGLPPEINNETRAYEYFGIENWQTAWINVMGLLPAFERKVIEETEDRLIYRDGNGCTAEMIESHGRNTKSGSNRLRNASPPIGLNWSQSTTVAITRWRLESGQWLEWCGTGSVSRV